MFMFVSTPLPEPAAPAGEHDAFYREVLHELIEMGTELARSVHREATADVAPAVDLTARFERACRCVRRSILLARSLDLPARVRAGRRVAARRQVIRAVEDRIDDAEEGAEADRLHEELLERLERPELDEDLADRPVEEVIREICRDLGLEEIAGFHPWRRRTPEDISVLCARAAGSGAGQAAAGGPDDRMAEDGVLARRLLWRGRGPPVPAE